MKAAFVITSLAALFLIGIIFHMNSSTQKNNIIPKSEPDDSYDKKYDALQRELDDLKKRMEESQNQSQKRNQAQTQSQNKYADVIEKCRPSMVFIQTIKGKTLGFGSGFFVNENGDILTNHHVINN